MRGGGYGGANHNYGLNVVTNSSSIIISAHGDMKVYVHESSGIYLLRGIISKVAPHFGVSLDANDDIIAIGSPTRHDGLGEVFIYDSSTLNLISTLSPSDGANNDNFGRSIAVSSDEIDVGSPMNDGADNTVVDDNTGSVYVYNASTRTFMWKVVLQDLQGNA